MATTVTFIPKRVEVNLNAVASDGTIRAGLEIGAVDLAPGAHVLIYDPDDEVEGTAVVARVNRAARLAYLQVHWSSLRDLQAPAEVAVGDGTSTRLAGEPTTPFNRILGDLPFRGPRLVAVGR